MARVTIEDCLEVVNNRFELVLLAAKRARDLSRGRAQPQIDWGNDKSTVLALREIAKGHVTLASYEEAERERLNAEESLDNLL